MIKKKQWIVITNCVLALLISTLFTGCSQDKKEVNKAVTTFFSAYQKDDYRKIDRQLFSDQLANRLNWATEKEEKEIQIVLNSNYPSDKPFILDFDIFTSMTEGADSIQILQTTIKTDTAWVDVLFANTLHNHTVSWKDKLVFIKRTNWKLENIIYGETGSEFKSLQDLLEDYINAGSIY